MRSDMLCRNNDYDRVAFRERPWFGVLLFDNVSSDARDHAANERSMSTRNKPGDLTANVIYSISVLAEA